MATSRSFAFTEILFINIFICLISTYLTDKVETVKSITNFIEGDEMAAKQIFALDFEVFGKVQGVFFRKHTEKQAKQLGLRGWCMNTSQGTVRGQMEGELDRINEMKYWLQTKGSPKSRIDKTAFSEYKEIPDYTFKAFSIKR